MSDTKPKRKQFWWNLLRWGVTLGAVAYVFSQITWKDRLLIPAPDGKGQVAVWGWVRPGPDGNEVLVADDGARHAIPVNLRDDRFVPGFWTLLKGLDRTLLLIAIMVYPVGIFLLAWRWQLLLKTHGLDPGYMEALRLNWIGLFTSFVLPGSNGGDLVKGYCIYRRSPGKRLAAVMTVFLDRVVGLVSLMLIGTVAILLQADAPELRQASMATEWILAAVLVGGLVFFSGRLRKLLRVSEIVERLPFPGKIKEVDDSVFHYRHHIPLLFGNVAISFVIHACTIWCIYLLGQSLGLKVPMIYYFAALPVIFTVGAVAPSIGGLGVVEGMFQYFFTQQGATTSSAVALCIVYRLMVLISTLPGAVFTYREFWAGGLPKMNEDPALDPRAPVAEPSVSVAKAQALC